MPSFTPFTTASTPLSSSRTKLFRPNDDIRSIPYLVMNISSVSSVSYSATTTSSSAASIAQIKKQIQALEKQIAAENASNDDAQTKMQKTQQYQTQLQALNAQLATLQSAKS